ncbi:uncharacterized protein LOC110844390 isoform X2 [Folsomia candida]|uniref:uncharacterized protein LOC110844390 isoform X2 n=1 Tax=Folsomia candida TaxID=158441 RepID=UPI000B8F77C0|nr:uncharacterized protein LOC110844390 isoform X2 [Folsomia candida]
MSNLPLETPTTAPAPVVYARKSQPILRPDPQIDIGPLAAETVADDSSTLKFVPLTPVQAEATPKLQGPSVAGTSQEEGETDSRILNAALTALQSIHSVVGNESSKPSNRVLHLESKPLVADNNVGLANHGSRGGEIPLIPNSLARRSIPPKKQQRFSCPNCQKTFINEVSLDAHVCNQSAQNSKTPKSEIINKGKRKISQAGRKPKMSDSYPNLPSPSQVERGLPLKKRGRPVKHALFVPSTAKAQPQKQQLTSVITNVTTPTHNSNPQTAPVPNGINKANVEQSGLEPGTPQNSSEIMMDQASANSGQRSQRKRNLPKWYENMVLDDNLMMGTAGRGNRTPVIASPVAANRKLLHSGPSSEVAAQVKPVMKLQKMDTGGGKTTEPPRKVSKSAISESLSTKTSEMSPKLLPQKAQARIRRPPPSKDLDDHPMSINRSVVKEVKTQKAVAKISPMKEITTSDNVASLAAKSNGNNSKGPMDEVQSSTAIPPSAPSTIQSPDLTHASTEIDVNNTAELSSTLTEGENQTDSIAKSERKPVCTPNVPGDNSNTAPGQKIISPPIQNNTDTVAKSTTEAAPTLKPQKVDETSTIVKITGINSGHIASSITTITAITTPQIQRVSESQKKVSVKALPPVGKGKPTTKRSDSNRTISDQTRDLNSNGSVKQVVLIAAPKTPQPILKTAPSSSNSLSVSSSGPTTRKRKLEDDNNGSKTVSQEEIPKTDANGAKKLIEPAKRTRQSIVAMPPIKKSQQTSKPISEIKQEKTCDPVDGTTSGVMNGFGSPVTPGLSQAFVGMPRLQNQSGLPIMEDSDNSSDDEDPTSTATPNSSRSSRPYIKETVIRFLENKISNRNMLRIREELMTLKQSGNYFKLTKTAPMAAGLVHDMFCQYFGTHDPVEDEMQ